MSIDAAIDLAPAAFEAARACGVEPATLWRHKGGAVYRVVMVSVCEAKLEPLVSYHSPTRPWEVWTRTLSAWREVVRRDDGVMVPRFEPLFGEEVTAKLPPPRPEPIRAPWNVVRPPDENRPGSGGAILTLIGLAAMIMLILRAVV